MAQYSKTNLIVNYLPQEMTDEQLRAIFDSEAAGVKSVKICRNNVTGYSYGYGFCEYHTHEAACRAVAALNGRQIGRKTLKVAPARLRSEQTRNCKVRLSGLPSWVTQESAQQALSAFGSIISCRVLLDQQGACRGVGFCLFETRASAERAMHAMHGRPWPGSQSAPIHARLADQNEKMVRSPGQEFRQHSFGQREFGQLGHWQQDFGHAHLAQEFAQPCLQQQQQQQNFAPPFCHFPLPAYPPQAAWYSSFSA